MKLGRAGGRAKCLGDIPVPSTTETRGHHTAGQQHADTGSSPSTLPGCSTSCWAPESGSRDNDSRCPQCGQDKLRPTSLQLRFNSCKSDSAEGGGGGVGWKYRERRKHCSGKGFSLFPGPGTSHGCPGAEGARGLGCSPESCFFPTPASRSLESPQPFLPPPAAVSPSPFSPAHLLAPPSAPRARIERPGLLSLQRPEGTSRATCPGPQGPAGLRRG